MEESPLDKKSRELDQAKQELADIKQTEKQRLGNLSQQEDPKTNIKTGIHVTDTPEGKIKEYYDKKGVLRTKVLPDGTEEYYRENGVLSGKILPDETEEN